MENSNLISKSIIIIETYEMINLKKARSILGVSQWTLEMRSGVHQSRISLFENGLKSPKEIEKVKLTAALGLGPNDIEWPNNGGTENGN